ncbi:hypothetical protein Q8F55_008136 [Vanrija albida]|uniref:FAD dependent oxidoreductase domain-containing protein n=1 Tax=Vanrija albida TaxID=181172 RepID=A0ABR3PVH4_9TREE
MPFWPQPYESTTSHWQQTNRGPTSLWDHGRDAALPAEADYVIVGAGVTGASLAYHLTRPGATAEGKRVVVLDAKDVGSGASGRNGGHVSPRSFMYLSELWAPLEHGGGGLSMEQSVEAWFFELDNLEYIERLVKDEGLDVDFWRGERYEVFTSEERVAENRAAYAKFTTAIAASRFAGRKLPWTMVDDPAKAKELSRNDRALALNIGPAGSWHPHRGVTALLRLALGSTTSKCDFFSWCPVQAFARAGDGWALDCGERGTIRAKHVILATNAYTRHLFPGDTTGLKDHLVPTLAQAGRVVPPASFAGPRALDHTYAVELGPYLIQTPHAGLVLGPYIDVLEKGRIHSRAELFYQDDDSKVTDGVRRWLQSYCGDDFTGWGQEGPGEGLVHHWSGILAISLDAQPLVGPVPDHPGLWLAAGYNGHGMAMIVNLTRSLASHLKTGEWDAYMPRHYAITKERLDRAQKHADKLT